jgi:hypothetical protein
MAFRDTSESDQTQGLASDLGADQGGGPPAGPGAGAQLAFALAGATRDHQQQRYREIRGAVGQDFRGVADGQSLRARRLDVKVVIADLVVRDQPCAARRSAAHHRCCA